MLRVSKLLLLALASRAQAFLQLPPQLLPHQRVLYPSMSFQDKKMSTLIAGMSGRSVLEEMETGGSLQVTAENSAPETRSVMKAMVLTTSSRGKLLEKNV